ncbi:MAG: hypothetical protein ACREU7_14745 [Burkholderiales bacterium]
MVQDSPSNRGAGSIHVAARKGPIHTKPNDLRSTRIAPLSIDWLNTRRANAMRSPQLSIGCRRAYSAPACTGVPAKDLPPSGDRQAGAKADLRQVTVIEGALHQGALSFGPA